MANGFLMAAIIAAIALTFWRPFRRVRSALGLGHLVSTGHVFIGVGCLLGLLFEERHSPISKDLGPIVAFVAGWVGFATGVRFDWRVLRTIPARALGVALGPGLAAAVACGGAAATFLHYAGASSAEAVGGALVIGAAAATSGPTLVAVVRTRRAGRATHARPVLRMIELSAGVDDLVVVVLSLGAFSLAGADSAVVLIGAALLGGILLGTVTWLFLGGRANEDERLLLGLAMLAFIGGYAGWLRLSPASVGMVAAIVLVNLPGERMTQLVRVVRRVERPAVVILMTVIGFHVAGELTWPFWPLLATMTLGRFFVKVGSGALLSGTIALSPGARQPGLYPARAWGAALIPQGVLGLMVTLSLFYVWGDGRARNILAAVAIGGVVNELLAPWMLSRVLEDSSKRGGPSHPSHEKPR